MGCKLPTVNKFLFCLSLDTGGFVIGWIAAILSGIAILGTAAIAIFAIIALGSTTLKEDEKGALIAAIVIMIIFCLYFCLVFFAAVRLISGTKNRNHKKMKLYMILMGIGVVLSFLQIFTTAGAGGIVSAILSAVIAAYFFICIYSLYESVKTGTPY